MLQGLFDGLRLLARKLRNHQAVGQLSFWCGRLHDRVLPRLQLRGLHLQPKRSLYNAILLGNADYQLWILLGHVHEAILIDLRHISLSPVRNRSCIPRVTKYVFMSSYLIYRLQ